MKARFGIWLFLSVCLTGSVASADLVAHWQFEPGALAWDSSGNGYSLSGSGVSLSTSEVAPGTNSTASAHFAGSGFLKTLGNLDLNAYPGKNVRVSFWMKNLDPVTTSSIGTVFIYGDSWNQTRGSLLAAANALGATGVPGRAGCVGIQLDDDRAWEHVNYDTMDNGTGVWERYAIEYRPDAPAADVVRVFKDGVLIPDADPAPWNRHYSRYVDGGSSGGDQSTTLANETLYIGGRFGMELPYFGLLDEVRLVDNATQDVIAEWRFESDAFLADSSGNGYDLVVPADSYGGVFEETAPDGTGCAFFDGTGYLKTAIPLDLSAYDNVSLEYKMFNYAPYRTPAGVLFEQGENADDQEGFYVVVNETGDASAQMGQVGVKTPGIVRDGLPHSSLDWADWETPVWEEYAIDFDLTAETFEDRVRITHDGETLDDIVFSPSDLDGEGNKQMIGSSDVGMEPWVWPELKFEIGANGSASYFHGYIDEMMIEVFADGPGASVPEPAGLLLLIVGAAMAFSRRTRIFPCLVLVAVILATGPAAATPLQIATFQADITPPLGSPLCFDLVTESDSVVDRLSARGVVLITDDDPIVICSLDWIGAANSGYDQFRAMLADAAGTTPDRVALHAIHQHDAPGADFDTELLLADAGISGAGFNPNAARVSMLRTAAALEAAMESPVEVTHIGIGSGIVEQVASNRRILGEDGRVERMRFTACTDPIAIAAPEGTIDPECKLISFWNGSDPVASMTHYATHPQSYYGSGDVSYDFPGMARAEREDELPDVFHMHFNGAGGNIGAGKYNTGAPENRPVLAGRLADGMAEAWNNQTLVEVSAETVEWTHTPVVLPVASSLTEEYLLPRVYDTSLSETERVRCARELVYARRMAAGEGISINCLDLGDDASIMYMPGELFVEYQLAAQAMRPDKVVAMAAYGDYGTGYIGTEIAYWEGGYETGRASLTTGDCEAILMEAMEDLLFDRIIEGDADGDGFVGSSDLDIVRAYWGSTVTYGNYTHGDLSGDGLVGSADLDVVRANWGTGTPPASVPEPALWMLCVVAMSWSLIFRRSVARLACKP